MKRLIGIVAILGVLIAGYMVLVKRGGAESQPVIAIIQTASHSALDATCSGFVQHINKNYPGVFKIVIKNAEGSVVNAQAIAQSLAARSDVVAYVAIATPAAQAIAKYEKQRPIFISAVTYPDQIGVIQPNVVGITDMFNLEDLVAFMHTAFPHAKRAGILFNAGSEVAQQERDNLINLCKKHAIEPVIVAGVTELDIITALKASLRKIDMCIAPTDNMIANAVPTLADACLQVHVPFVFAVAGNTVTNSKQLAGYGIDYGKHGQELGVQFADWWSGKKNLNQLGIQKMKPTCTLNLSALKAYEGTDMVNTQYLLELSKS